MAATNRIIAVSKSLIAYGAKVHICIPFPTEDYGKTNLPCNVSGALEGISYFFPSGREKSKYKALRIMAVLSGFRKTKGYILSALKIILMAKSDYFDLILVYYDTPFSIFWFAKIAKRIKSKSVHIFDEYPTPIRHKLKTKIPFWKSLAYKQVLKKVNGYITISRNLEKYFCELCHKKTFIMPLVIDLNRFNLSDTDRKSVSDSNYMCYMGNMELSKDNVDLIVKAFAIIHLEFPELELHLYGTPSYKNKQIIADLIHELNLSKKVKMMGVISGKEVPRVLRNAILLVSSQPNTKRASGGFPTKLGEYLMSGVPVLITDVGENSQYAKNGEHLFLVPPENENDYAEKLRAILNNYEKSLKVADNGKSFITENYSHLKIGADLVNFIKSI